MWYGSEYEPWTVYRRLKRCKNEGLRAGSRNDAVGRSGETVKQSGFEKVVVNWQKQFQNSVLDSDNCSNTAC